MNNRYFQSGVVLSVGVLILCFCGVSSGDHVPVVLQPPGLNPGDEYRLLFVTSATRDATSSNIDDYNAFVQAAADDSALSVLGQTWKAIVSTETVDAIVNTNTTTSPLTEPIYSTADTVLFNHTSEIWTIEPLASVLDEHADALVAYTYAWTGTGDGGVATDYPMGNSLYTTFGSPTTSRWLKNSITLPTNDYHLMALSGVITAVPEPTTFILCLVGLVCVGLVARRKRYARRCQHPANHS